MLNVLLTFVPTTWLQQPLPCADDAGLLMLLSTCYDVVALGLADGPASHTLSVGQNALSGSITSQKNQRTKYMLQVCSDHIR